MHPGRNNVAFQDICVVCNNLFERGEQGIMVKTDLSTFNKGNVVAWAHVDCIEEYNENNYVQLKLFR